MTDEERNDAEGRIEDLAEAPSAEAEEAKADWRDKYLRTLAELDNYRKRSEKEVEQRRRYALESFLRQLLPVLDALEHAVAAEGGADAIREGVRLALADAGSVLKRAGVEPIEAVGQPFDPRFHEAAGMEPAGEGQAHGTILREERKGYRFHDRVLRPSRVHIAVALAAPGDADEDEEE